jgi:bilirubin oxidase
MSAMRLAVLALFSTLISADKFPWQSPEYKHIFEFPLPAPPIKEALKTFTSPSTGKPIDYYEVEIKDLSMQTYPELGPTKYVGYDGIFPGPTFHMVQGREAIVRFINHAELANSVHLHGSFSRAPFDGWADDITAPGQYKDYYYPNAQNARTLWYHDHAVDHTAENAYFGQAGFYILHDDQELSLNLPQDKYVCPYNVKLPLPSMTNEVEDTLYSKKNHADNIFLTTDMTFLLV